MVGAPCGDKVDVFFGQNVCHFQSEGTVRLNDEVSASPSSSSSCSSSALQSHSWGVPG